MAEVRLVEASQVLTHVAVSGRLDAAGVGQVDLKLSSLTVALRRPAVIDLSEVTLLTSLGIGMLATVAKAMRSHGLKVAVVAADPQVTRVLEMASVATLLPVAPTREDALRALA